MTKLVKYTVIICHYINIILFTILIKIFKKHLIYKNLSYFVFKIHNEIINEIIYTNTLYENEFIFIIHLMININFFKNF